MQRKDLALRVLSTAAIMSIVTSIAAPAFAGTYYMGNGNLSIRKEADGTVWVKSGDTENKDLDKEVIICGGAGENKWSNAPSGGAAAATGTEGSAAGESQPDPNAGSTLNETKEDSAQTKEGSAQTKEGSAQTEEGSAQTKEGSAQTEEGSAQTQEGSAQTKEGSAQTKEDSAQTQQGKDNTKEEDSPKDPSTEPAPTTSADPEEKTLKTTQADTTTTPAAEEPSTELEDVTVEKAYKPKDPTSAASSNLISVINNCLDKVLNIRLSNVNIKKTVSNDTAPMTVDGKGDTTIELDGNNVLDASTPRWKSAAGLEKTGTGTLTITDTDSITAADGTQDNTLRGSLTAIGGEDAYGGAGIGSRGTKHSNEHHQTENITIAGNAYVKAYGTGNASGIGGGFNGNAKNITIKDNAYVVAKGSGAGIGSGVDGGSSDVKIQGGTVVAEGKYTGIGGDYDKFDFSGENETSTIEISGGTVYANGNAYGDGVSIGSAGGNSEITISGNAKVKNTGRMGSYAYRNEKANATITIKDNAMIADGSGGIGGDTNTNITIQDNAVIGNLRKFGPRPNEWSGYIGTMTDGKADAKATVQIKDNALIKDVAFIGGRYTMAGVKIKIQDNAHIKKIAFTNSSLNIPAIGSDLGRADVTIGGSSDPTKPQQGTVRIDYAERRTESGGGRYTVIGSAYGGGNVSIEGNVELNLVSWGADYDWTSYVKGDTVMRPEQLRDMIGKDSTIYLRNNENGKLENIVHGKNVCAHVTGEKTGRKQDATCTEDGWVEYRCNYEALNSATKNSCDRIWQVPISKKGHSYGAWTIVTAATCTSNGSKERECSVCHQKETETITALGHDFHGTETVTKAPTCAAQGTKLVKCTRCDVSESQLIPIDHNAHNYQDDWAETTRATCTIPGVETRYCHNDNRHFETRPTGLNGNNHTGHGTQIVGYRAPTCTTPGYTGNTYCNGCNQKIADGTVIPITPHHWVDNGEANHICDRDHVTTEAHSYGEWTTVTAATCTTAGEEKHTCSVCGHEQTRPIPATGHHWKDNGDGTHTCTKCGATEGQPSNTNSALELRVVDAEGMDQPFTVSQNGTLRTYTGAYDIATLTGDLNTLRYLQDHGAQTIQFVTNGQTSSFAINDLLAQGSGSEVFYLTHRGAEEPTLLLVEADHSELVKD